MTQRVDLSNLPDDLKERVQFARDWWDDETRRLPGEERLNTVFVIIRWKSLPSATTEGGVGD